MVATPAATSPTILQHQPNERPDISGYDIGECIHASRRSLVFRATRLHDARATMVKVLRADHPTEREVARLEVGWHIGSQIHSDLIIGHVELLPHRSSLALITEDFGAVSLRGDVQPEGMPLRPWLDLAIATAKALVDMHQHRVIHKDIKPDNIVRNHETGVLKLIDFGLSHRLHREEPLASAPGVLEGTLAYMSPEQTGRMNRSLDHRSDLYSLGVTLFELLTGARPFTDTDPISLIHAVLTRVPPSVSSLRPDVPGPVADIIHRLLIKTPEDRYQSAFGLVVDLETCRDSLLRQGTVEHFVPGQRDVSTILRIPERLYGREQDTSTLLEAFDRTALGGRSLLLVAGWSGVGKTALIREVHKPIVAKRGRFCAGKFDQYRRDIPYQALATALRGLLAQVLTEPEEQLAHTRKQLLDALGHHGAALAELLPELTLITGALPDADDIGHMEARLRFHESFKRFIGVFARETSPLVIFLDDLQWADLPSLAMIEVLLGADRLSHLLIIGAYRDDEVHADHPLRQTIVSLEEDERDVDTIALQPLSQSSTNTLVRDALSVSEEDAAALGKVIYDKTGGNPFFVRETLGALVRDGHLQFDLHRRCWHWDIEAVRATPLTANVVELLAGRIQALPPAPRGLLPIAGCMGRQFDLATLSELSDLADPAAVHHALDAPIAEGLITPIGDAHRRVASVDPSTVRYTFTHDRVHQAAYLELDASERAQISLRIARMLRARQDANVIDIASHYEIAHELLDADERVHAGHAHLAAGQRAKASLALEPARHFLRQAHALLPDNPWESDRDHTMQIHLELVDAEMRTGGAEQAERLAEEAVAHASAPLEVMPIYGHRIQERISRLAYEDALLVTRDGLAQLGFRIPAKPGPLHVVQWLLRTKYALWGKTPEDLIEMEEASAEVRAAQDLLMTASAAAYYTSPEWLMVLSLEGMRLSAAHGVTSQTPYSCAMYALVTGAVMGDYPMAERVGKAGWALLDRFNSEHLRAKMVVIEGGFVRNWLLPARDMVRWFFEGWPVGVDHGDITYASYTLVQGGQIGFVSGADIPSMLERFEQRRVWFAKSGQEQSLTPAGSWIQLMHILHDPDTRTPEVTGIWLDADQELAAALAREEDTSIAFASLVQGVAAYFFGDIPLAADKLALSRKHAEGIAGMIQVTMLDLFQGLTAATQLRRGDRSAAKVMRQCHKALSKWAGVGPEHAHRLAVLEAEMLRAKGASPLTAYRDAAALCREGGFVQFEALCWSNMGDTLLDMGLDVPGYAALARASHLYRRWGANALANRLQERLPEEHALVDAQSLTSTDSTTLTTTHGDALDLHSALTAARSISEEIELPKLLDRVMASMLQGAGAERCLLWLVDRGELTVVAHRHSENASRLPEDPHACPRTVIAWVQRAGEPRVLYDAMADDVFGRDEDVVARSLRSVLAAPLLHKGDLLGVIYVENQLAPGMFTHERLETVQLLASQAAVSIQNSELFAEQRKLVTSFHRFVPEPFLEHLGLDSVVEVRPGDAVQRRITVFFSDIRGFTTMSESRTPREIFDLLNLYFEHTAPAVNRHGGFIDKFIGDAIMALFPGSAVAAALAAVEMQQQLAKLNATLGDSAMGTGVGLHTGMLTLGTVGTAERMDTTVIGDTVNLSARIEGLTKRYGARVLLSEVTAEEIPEDANLTLRMVGRAQVVGKTTPTTLYELLEAESGAVFDARMANLERYRGATDAFFDGRIAEALGAFQACIASDPADKASGNYAARCEELLRTGLPEGFTGVEIMNKK